MDMFLTMRLYLHVNCIILLSWIVLNGTVFDIQTVLTLNWNVWNWTDHSYENGLGIKEPTKVDMP